LISEASGNHQDPAGKEEGRRGLRHGRRHDRRRRKNKWRNSARHVEISSSTGKRSNTARKEADRLIRQEAVRATPAVLQFGPTPLPTSHSACGDCILLKCSTCFVGQGDRSPVSSSRSGSMKGT